MMDEATSAAAVERRIATTDREQLIATIMQLRAELAYDAMPSEDLASQSYEYLAARVDGLRFEVVLRERATRRASHQRPGRTAPPVPPWARHRGRR